MRHMPRASASVATIGRPSGIAATASAIAASTIRKASLPVVRPTPAIKAVRTIVAQTSWPESRARRFSSGELSGSASSTSCEMRPSSVARPVAATTPVPLPRVTEVPLNSIEVRSRDAGIGRDRRRRLVDRDRLAGERRLVGAEMGGLDQPQVGRDGIAAFHQHDVARHQLVGRDQAGVTVAAHPGRVGAERAQRLDRARRSDLGDEADQRVDRQHGRDGGRFFQLAEIECQRSRGAEQIDHRALELVQQHRQHAGLTPRHDGVQPEGLQPALDLVLVEAAGDRDVQLRQHLAGRQCLRRIGQPLQLISYVHADPVRARRIIRRIRRKY